MHPEIVEWFVTLNTLESSVFDQLLITYISETMLQILSKFVPFKPIRW